MNEPMSEFVERRYATIVDALKTEDRRGRGYISIDRCLEIYLLYFNASAGELKDHELAAFVEPFTHDAPERTLPGAPTLRVVDYMAFAAALAERDQKFVDEKPTTTRAAAPARPPSSEYQHVPIQRQRSPGGTPFTQVLPPRGRTRHMAGGTGHRLPALSPLGVEEAALVREEVRPPDKLEQRFGRRPRNQLTSLGDALGESTDIGAGSETPLVRVRVSPNPNPSPRSNPRPSPNPSPKQTARRLRAVAANPNLNPNPIPIPNPNPNPNQAARRR